MHIALKGILVFFGLGLLLLGFIFLIAGGAENLLLGGAQVLVGLVLLAVVYLDSRNEAKQPIEIQQTLNVSMGGSGEFEEQDLYCPGCGAAAGEDDVKLIEGGLMLVCPYCGKSTVLEEQPKW
jgi:hypothetical protein